jgi:hypothetical protein
VVPRNRARRHTDAAERDIPRGVSTVWDKLSKQHRGGSDCGNGRDNRNDREGATWNNTNVGENNDNDN